MSYRPQNNSFDKLKTLSHELINAIISKVNNQITIKRIGEEKESFSNSVIVDLCNYVKVV